MLSFIANIALKPKKEKVASGYHKLYKKCLQQQQQKFSLWNWSI